jgi:starvation-inducible DNA-binding protein
MPERKRTIKSMLPMRNGVSEEKRKGMIALLHQQLADHYALVTKTRFYHWNVEGPEFHDIHKLLDEHYEIIGEQVDQIAEQALKLGGQAPGTLAWFKEHSRLEEDKGETIPNTLDMIKNLVEAHESILECLYGDITTIDEEYKDAVTSNLLQEISDQHHKMAWTLRMIMQPTALESATAK